MYKDHGIDSATISLLNLNKCIWNLSKRSLKVSFQKMISGALLGLSIRQIVGHLLICERL